MEPAVRPGHEHLMMSQLMLVTGTAVLLGAALVGGVFFAFSSFVMKALAELPPAKGIAAMQSINIVVINPSFLGAFIGTGLLSLLMAGLALGEWGRPGAVWFLGGAICYVGGTLMVTVLGNVPLNDRLAAVSPTDTTAPDLWLHYLKRWLGWNHVRTAAALVAALLYALGLLQQVDA